jgi:hypothetical protein
LATNIDTLLANTTVVVDGSAITISGLSANEQAILAVALAALYRSVGQGGVGAAQAVSCRVARSGGNSVIAVTAGTG